MSRSTGSAKKIRQLIDPTVDINTVLYCVNNPVHYSDSNLRAGQDTLNIFKDEILAYFTNPKDATKNRAWQGRPTIDGPVDTFFPMEFNCSKPTNEKNVEENRKKYEYAKIGFIGRLVRMVLHDDKDESARESHFHPMYLLYRAMQSCGIIDEFFYNKVREVVSKFNAIPQLQNIFVKFGVGVEKKEGEMNNNIERWFGSTDEHFRIYKTEEYSKKAEKEREKTEKEREKTEKAKKEREKAEKAEEERRQTLIKKNICNYNTFLYEPITDANIISNIKLLRSAIQQIIDSKPGDYNITVYTDEKLPHPDVVGFAVKSKEIFDTYLNFVKEYCSMVKKGRENYKEKKAAKNKETAKSKALEAAEKMEAKAARYTATLNEINRLLINDDSIIKFEYVDDKLIFNDICIKLKEYTPKKSEVLFIPFFYNNYNNQLKRNTGSNASPRAGNPIQHVIDDTGVIYSIEICKPSPAAGAGGCCPSAGGAAGCKCSKKPRSIGGFRKTRRSKQNHKTRQSTRRLSKRRITRRHNRKN
jgi:hypothetical protein